VALTSALHHAFLALAVLTVLSSFTFWTLRKTDGEAISHAKQRDEESGD
jgi:hypothetical protein